MPYARIIPILPGQVKACQRFVEELLTTQRAAFSASQRAEGITEAHFLIQSDHLGDRLIVTNDGEAQARERVRQRQAHSTDPFDVWFREQFRAIHGISLEHPPEGGARVDYLGSWRAASDDADGIAASRATSA